MSATNKGWPGKRLDIDPERFRELVQRMNRQKAALDAAEVALSNAASTREEVSAKYNEARALLQQYIQECGGP